MQSNDPRRQKLERQIDSMGNTARLCILVKFRAYKRDTPKTVGLNQVYSYIVIINSTNNTYRKHKGNNIILYTYLSVTYKWKYNPKTILLLSIGMLSLIFKKSLNRKREHLVVALDFQQRRGRDFCVGGSLPQEMLDRWRPWTENWKRFIHHARPFSSGWPIDFRFDSPSLFPLLLLLLLVKAGGVMDRKL